MFFVEQISSVGNNEISEPLVRGPKRLSEYLMYLCLVYSCVVVQFTRYLRSKKHWTGRVLQY